MGGMPESVRRIVNLESANGHAPELGTPGSLLPEAGRVEGNGPKQAEAPSGVELLVNLIGFIRRFVALSDAQGDIVALWAVHTHALDAADCTGYLSITSAEKRSGKTRLLEVLALLVALAWLTGRVTPAVLVRKVAAETPTLLLDESDAAFKGDREYAETLRAVLNSGFRRGGVASLCVGQGANLSYQDFAVFGPKAIAGIGKLPDTVADRSIPIELRRRRPGEVVERFRLRKAGPEALPLQRAAAAWAEANVTTLAEAEPELPDELDDRAQDIIEPLLAIADEAGGEWPERARRAAVELLSGEGREDSDSLGVRLLKDLRAVFEEERADRLATGALLAKLHKMEEAPWASLRGEPLDARGLARFLKPYGVKPEQLRINEDKVRGYRRASFEDTWSRYVPDDYPPEEDSAPSPSEAVQAVHPVHPADRAKVSVPDKERVPGAETYPVHGKPHRNADVPLVPDVPDNPGTGEDRAASNGCDRLTPEQVEVYKRRRALGDSQEEARRVARGEEVACRE